MMKYTFQDVIAKIEHNLETIDEGFTLPLMPQLNKIIGNISSGLYTAIGGLPGSGLTSFVDQNYVMGPLLQWYTDTNPDKKDLKILYFSTNQGEIKKIQQLICLFSRLLHGIHVDIPTLNSKPGRLYDLRNEEVVIDSLKIAQGFFDDVLEQQLMIIPGEFSPTIIHNKVLELIDTVDIDHTNIMVVLDSTTYLKDDVEKFGTITGKELDKKMDSLIKDLTYRNDITFTVTVPIKPSIVRHVKETEPHYSQLSHYVTNCHRGIVLYNPLVEKHPNYLQDQKKFINHNGINTLRTWTVVRNTEGKEAVEKPLLLLPGTGFMLEIDSTSDVSDFEDVKELLQTPDSSTYYGYLEIPETSKNEDTEEVEEAPVEESDEPVAGD